jgi:hypothetical protein
MPLTELTVTVKATDIPEVREVMEAADALLEDTRQRNAHRSTDLAGTVQVSTDALQRLHRALRGEASA